MTELPNGVPELPDTLKDASTLPEPEGQLGDDAVTESVPTARPLQWHKVKGHPDAQQLHPGNNPDGC